MKRTVLHVIVLLVFAISLNAPAKELDGNQADEAAIVDLSIVLKYKDGGSDEVSIKNLSAEERRYIFDIVRREIHGVEHAAMADDGKAMESSVEEAFSILPKLQMYGSWDGAYIELVGNDDARNNLIEALIVLRKAKQVARPTSQAYFLRLHDAKWATQPPSSIYKSAGTKASL